MSTELKSLESQLNEAQKKISSLETFVKSCELGIKSGNIYLSNLKNQTEIDEATRKIRNLTTFIASSKSSIKAGGIRVADLERRIKDLSEKSLSVANCLDD